MANAPKGKIILEKLYEHLNKDKNKRGEDFEFYDINLIEDKKNHIYMSITTILKEYPKIMIESGITDAIYKDFSDELKNYALDSSNTNKSCCDLILFDIICSMRLDLLSVKYKFNELIQKVPIYSSLDEHKYLPDTGDIYSGKKISVFLSEDDVQKALKIINDFIKDFSIPMEKKYKVYKIIYLFLNKIYDKTQEPTKTLLDIFKNVIGTMACAPRTIIHGLSGGYNNKSGDIDYHICKANFKQTFKKVSAKSAREGAKMVAMKVLKDKKKSVKFSLKRMIGKKEKCYDYDVSIDKSGKIIIKNQS